MRRKSAFVGAGNGGSAIAKLSALHRDNLHTDRDFNFWRYLTVDKTSGGARVGRRFPGSGDLCEIIYVKVLKLNMSKIFAEGKEWGGVHVVF